MSQEISSHEQNGRASVAVRAPASLSNLGPGFDCLGFAIEDWGDTAEATPNDLGEVRIRFHDRSPWKGPTAVAENTAGRSAELVLRSLGIDSGVDLVIQKGIVPGSGAGSSAASAAAGAWAVAQLFTPGLTKEELIEAVLSGESLASGSRHGDNALPALFGGIVVVSAMDPAVYRRISSDLPPSISILMPEMEILTRVARRILPKSVQFRAAVENASNLALMVSAMQAGDWADAGRFMMLDQFAEPARSQLIPGFSNIRDAAVEAGAFGCALSGSGPAIFAVSDSDARAELVLSAMMQASESARNVAHGTVTHIEWRGVHTLMKEVQP